MCVVNDVPTFSELKLEEINELAPIDRMHGQVARHAQSVGM